MSFSVDHTAAGSSTGAVQAAGLPTGERKYWLEMEQGLFDSWDGDDEFEQFCHFLNDDAGLAAVAPEFETLRVLNCSDQRISHELLAADGFVLGQFVKCGSDEEVLNSSRYIIYEVSTTEPQRAALGTRLTLVARVSEAGRVRRPPCLRRIRGDFVLQRACGKPKSQGAAAIQALQCA
jgi:hypothetical protein